MSAKIRRNAEPIDSKALLNENSFNLYGSADNFSNLNFWYYTSVHTLDLILQNGYIWVSPLANMNDLHEAQLHSGVKSDVFALCFCNTDSEKIPMWYLYAGICGKGMRMGLTPAKMLTFIKSISAVYPVVDSKPKEDDPLLIGTDFSIDYGWIYYKDVNNDIKFKRKWYSIENDYKVFERDNYFIKDYPWEYEKEFRIIFKNNTGKHFDRIAVKISENILKDLKLSCAPEVDLLEDITSLKGFQKHLSRQIMRSTLSIKMNLMKRNKQDIVENLGSIVDEKNAECVCKAICSTRFCPKSKEKDEALAAAGV